MKVLIIRLDHLGDLLLTTPLIRALAKAGHMVSVVAADGTAGALDGNPHLSAHWGISAICSGFPRGWTRLGAWMRQQRFDAILLPHASPKELLFASLGSGVKQRIAMLAGVWGRLTLHRCLRSRLEDEPEHMSDVIMRCGEALGVDPQGRELDFHVTDESREWALRMCSQRFGSRCIVGIHPGCSGDTCNLPPAEYGRLAGLLLKRADIGIIVTGIASEKALLAAWPRDVQQSTRCWDSMGQLTLQQLAALIQRMAALVSVGTGPLHLASALRVRSVSPFCAYPPLSSAVWGNLGGLGEAVTPDPEFCRHRRKGPFDHCDFQGKITAEHLYERVVGLLSSQVEAKWGGLTRGNVAQL